jgi:hypothetical protein
MYKTTLYRPSLKRLDAKMKEHCGLYATTHVTITCDFFSISGSSSEIIKEIKKYRTKNFGTVKIKSFRR